MSKKGQLTMAGLLWFFVTLTIFWAVNALIFEFVDDIIANATASGDTTTATVARLIPFGLALGVALIPLQYAFAPRRAEEY